MRLRRHPVAFRTPRRHRPTGSRVNKRFRVTVCESAPELIGGGESWKVLCRQVSEQSSDLVLLNELPFGRWMSSGAVFCKAEWDASVELHRAGLQHLGGLDAAAVATTQPSVEGGRRVNEATLWSDRDGAQGIHTKQYFPDEPKRVKRTSAWVSRTESAWDFSCAQS
jgi:hypothetical protein